MADQRSIKKTMLMDEIRIIAGRKCDQQWAEFCGIRYKSTEIMYINFHLLLMEPKEKKKTVDNLVDFSHFPAFLCHLLVLKTMRTP